jgi:putative copper resistance protein D
MTNTWFILARVVHFSSCLLFFGTFAFDRLVAAGISRAGPDEALVYWRSRARLFSMILLPVILLSGILWLALVSWNISGQPLTMKILEIVWTQTQFGTVCFWRLFFWLAAAIVSGIALVLKPTSGFQNSLAWLGFLLGGCLLGSLAWAGHGQESSPWHLWADVLHLLVAGCWPGGLLPLFLCLRKLPPATDSANLATTASLVRRFSALSLASVALLTATGLVNSWFLVGSLGNLSGQVYGRWLLLKVVLFFLAISIGAVNLLSLKPRLSTEKPPAAEKAAALRLQFNVQMELLLAAAIVIVVAILGILPPANH